jgi:DNA-binding Lrp family transcriptional regulator
MERIGMSQQERDWLEWLKRTRDGMLTQKQAAEKMGVTERWVRELLGRLDERGDGVVVHRLRGQPSNRKIGVEVRAKALKVLTEPDWHDFGPTFASEQLAKRHNIAVSKETLRAWMMSAGLWKSRGRRREEVHCWRPRRSAFGELVQWDTSEHDWLEGRGEPVRYLVRLIDDATSWSWGRFVERDATPHNMGVLWEYLEKNGRMVEVYTDRDSMFAVPPRPGESREQQRQADRLTQLGRALRELGIGSVLAFSPQAKGRVERSFFTDQDRLVKLLRLAKISTREAANAFLETEYWPEWNERFARPVQEFPNQHRALTEQLELAAILCHAEPRVIGNDYTFSFAAQRYQIAREEAQAGMRRQPLRVELWLNGELRARYQGRYLNIGECSTRVVAPQLAAVRKPVRKDHNAGGKSSWMEGFFDRPSPPLWKAIGE